MADQQDGIGRFPVPRMRWISEQIPAELHGMFGYRGEPAGSEDDCGQDEIEYLYTIAYPDGSPYRIPVLVHYVETGNIPVVFIIDDEIVLDGVKLLVSDYECRRIEGGVESPYTYHRVTVRLPQEAARV